MFGTWLNVYVGEVGAPHMMAVSANVHFNLNFVLFRFQFCQPLVRRVLSCLFLCTSDFVVGEPSERRDARHQQDDEEEDGGGKHDEQEQYARCQEPPKVFIFFTVSMRRAFVVP